MERKILSAVQAILKEGVNWNLSSPSSMLVLIKIVYDLLDTGSKIIDSRLEVIEDKIDLTRYREFKTAENYFKLAHEYDSEEERNARRQNLILARENYNLAANVTNPSDQAHAHYRSGICSGLLNDYKAMKFSFEAALESLKSFENELEKLRLVQLDHDFWENFEALGALASISTVAASLLIPVTMPLTLIALTGGYANLVMWKNLILGDKRENNHNKKITKTIPENHQVSEDIRAKRMTKTIEILSHKKKSLKEIPFPELDCTLGEFELDLKDSVILISLKLAK